MVKKTVSKDDSKICAVLSYLLIGIIWYFADEKMKKSSFARFHAKQGLVLLIACIIYSVVISAIFLPLVFMSLGMLWPLMQLLNLIPWIFIILGIINALNGKEKELPLIGKFAEKFDF